MISINDYLDDILDDFHDYLSNTPAPKLCNLKSVNFDAGQLPDYTDIHVQQLYLLRYAFAYAFEYKYMYINLLNSFAYRDNMKVTSIGCGSMLDYWSLVMALQEIQKSATKIYYLGLDQIDWKYKIPSRKNDDMIFEQCNAVEAFEKMPHLDANVYFFPKSISEFSEFDFERICNCLKMKQIMPEKVHILVSIRADQFSMERDMARTEQIIRVLAQNGFETKDDRTHFWSLNCEEPKISKSDTDFKHPARVIETLKNLNERCFHFQNENENCDIGCTQRLSRWPILNKDKIKYQILTFVRG